MEENNKAKKDNKDFKENKGTNKASKEMKEPKKRKSELKGLMTEDEIKKKKSRRTKTMVSVFVLLLAVGIGGNWYLENSDVGNKISTIGANTKTFGEATYVDATTEPQKEEGNDYFSSARMDRENARDSSLEELQKVVNSTDESDDSRKVAAEKIASISSYIEIENKIESLVKAKGVKNCLAIVSEDGKRVDVIVDSKELTDELILQIKEISTEQLGCTFENVTIVQSN